MGNILTVIEVETVVAEYFPFLWCIHVETYWINRHGALLMSGIISYII